MAIQGRIQEFLIEGVQNLVPRGLLTLWQITSPHTPSRQGQNSTRDSLKKISQLKSYIQSLQSQGSIRSDGGDWRGGIGSATAILAVCPSHRESTKRSKERHMYRVS